MKTVSHHKISLAEVLPFVRTEMETLRARLRADDDLRVLADLPDGSFLTLMDCVASAHLERKEEGIDVLDAVDAMHYGINMRWLLEQCIDAGLVTRADLDKIIDEVEA
jgi:hypothetical protein